MGPELVALEEHAPGGGTSYDDCAIAVESTPIEIPILRNDTAGGNGGVGAGPPPEVVRVTAPHHGEARLEADGALIYQPEPGYGGSDSLSYQTASGGVDGAVTKVFVLVNPLTAGVDPDSFAYQDLALACATPEQAATGAKEIKAPPFEVPLPEPGQEVVVDIAAAAGSGEEVVLGAPAFDIEQARYFPVEGGVLVITPDGRLTYLAGLAEEGDAQPDFSVPIGGDPTQLYADELLGLAEAELVKRPLPPAEPRLGEVRAELATTTTNVMPGEPGTETVIEVGARTSVLAAEGQAVQVYGARGNGYVPITSETALGLLEGGLTLAELVPGAAPLQAEFQTLAFDPSALWQARGWELIAAGDDPFADALFHLWPEVRIVVLRDFVEKASGADFMPTLSVAGSPFVPADVLLAAAEPVVVPGYDGPAVRIPLGAFGPGWPPDIGPEHGGGAGFDGLAPGDIGAGPVPLLVLPPTERTPRPQSEPVDRRHPTGNRPPQPADDDGGLTQVDQTLVIDVLTNDRDPDGDPLRVTGIPGPPKGAATPVEDGTKVRYTPPEDPGGRGPVTDSFTYEVSDGRGGSSDATVRVAINRPPSAIDDTKDVKGVQPGESVVIDVLKNDDDLDDDGLEIVDLTPPGGGTASIAPDGKSVVYDPGAFVGRTAFTYEVTDGRGGTASARVDVEVERPVVPPGADARDDPAETLESVSVTIPILANDSFDRALPFEVDLGPLAPARGLVTSNADGTVTFDPAGAFDGLGAGEEDDVTFTYDLIQAGATDRATVTVTVIGENDGGGLTLRDNARETLESVPVTIDVLANDSGIDRPSGFTLDLGSQRPPKGVASVNLDDTITFDPAGDFDTLREGQTETVTFQYTVEQDGSAASATVTVKVIGEDEPPPPPEAPTLMVAAEVVTKPVLRPFDFATDDPFPELHDGLTPNGVDPSDLTLDGPREVAVSVVSKEAGFDNSLGVYKIEDGQPGEVEILLARIDPAGEPLTLDLDAGDEIGFFLVQDGAPLVDVPGASFAFRQVEGGPPELVRVVGDEESRIEAPVLHTHEGFNAGEQIQAVSGLNDAHDALKIGFEDKVRGPGQGADDDFDDAVIKLHYGLQTVDSDLELAVAIENDNPNLSRAVVRLTEGGGRLLLNDVVGGADGIRLSEDSTDDRVVLEGVAPLAAYEQALEAIDLAPPPNATPRSVAFQVFDDAPDAMPSNIDTIQVLSPMPMLVDAAAVA